jgi:hypothetical protein
MNSRFICLMRWNSTVDHIAGFAIYEETNIRTRRRFSFGLRWKRSCLHVPSLSLIWFMNFETSRVFYPIEDFNVRFTGIAVYVIVIYVGMVLPPPDSLGLLPAPGFLRTVRETFASHGSSIRKGDLWWSRPPCITLHTALRYQYAAIILKQGEGAPSLLRRHVLFFLKMVRPAFSQPDTRWTSAPLRHAQEPGNV